MNDNLELIKSEIYDAKSNLQKFNQLLQIEPENTTYSFYVTYFHNRLNILEQIKIKLESLDVIHWEQQMNKPTEKEIIQEANKLGYAYESDHIYVTLFNENIRIRINKQDKSYISYYYDPDIDRKFYRYINWEEHKLLTKILTYLGEL